MRARKQSGVSLLIVFIILLIGISSYLILSSDLNKRKVEKNQKTMQALNEAKLAIIGWSVRHKNPGMLPCPEDPSADAVSGEASSNCNELNHIGRLPWKTLGIGDIRDGNGDKLWYAMSPAFRSKPNLNTIATLNVNQQKNHAVAIVFSPGMPLASQSRVIQTDVNQYLDFSNVNGEPTFSMGPVKQDFNDVLLVVTKDDLFNAVNMRILAEIRGVEGNGGLISFYKNNGFYPYAYKGINDEPILVGNPPYDYLGLDSDIKKMLKNNGWFQLIEYQTNSVRNEVNLKLGNRSMKVVPLP